MRSEPSKEHARRAFEGMGYAVEEIPVGSESERRADLLVRNGDELFLVEAKGKEPHEAYRQLSASGSGHISRPLKPWRALSSVIEDAAEQLESTPATDLTGRLLWISALHADWEFVFDAMRMRLLGSVDLSCWEGTEQGTPEYRDVRPCYYYYHPDLARYPVLDGVVLAGPAGAQLILSDFGSLSDRFRASRLVKNARTSGSVVDVAERVASGEALSVLDAASRSSAAARWRYLKDTFGLLTSEVFMSDFRGLLRLSFEDPG